MTTLSRDGNGDYSLPSNTTSPAASGTTISSSDFNEVMDDLETALDESVFTAGTSGTDNVVVRADGTSGKKVQESGVAIDDSDNVSGVANLTVDAGGAVRTATGDTNTLLLQAYDVDGAAYTTFGTLTAGNTPTFDLASSVTLNSVAIADISSAQTLTNKTVDLASNTITGTTAEFNSALSNGSFATLAGTETLTNKTLTSPVINVTSDAQGDIYYRDVSGNFARLGPGSAGEVLQTGGAGANPSWTTAGAGDVTSSTTITDNTIVRGDGGAKGVQQSGVAIDDSDNVSGVANLTVDAAGAVRTATGDTNTLLLQAYDVDGAAYTTFATLTAGNTPTFDLSASTTIGTDTIVSLTGSQTLTNKTLTSPTINVGSDAQGDVYYRSSGGGIARLAPGSVGQVLQSGGAGADPSWATVSGTGDVTAASAFGTDNVLIRSDGAAKGVQSSGISIDDSNNITGINNVTGADTNLVSGTAGASGYLGAWNADGDLVQGRYDAATNVQVFTSSGTWTKPTGLTRVRVIVVGGGGAGGGAATTSGTEYSVGAGGGGGGVSLVVEQAASLGATETVTIGAGGAGGSATAGGSGGTSSFGAHASATGGSGGAVLFAFTSANRYSAGTLGGSGSSGDINLDGSPGLPAVSTDAGIVAGGNGGSTLYGGGAAGPRANVSGGSDGNAASGYGAGGSGAVSRTDANNRTGGSGAGGLIIVEEFF